MRHSIFKNKERKTINSQKVENVGCISPKARAQRKDYKIIKQSTIWYFKNDQQRSLRDVIHFMAVPPRTPEVPNPTNYSHDTKRPYQPPEDHPSPSNTQNQFHPTPRWLPTKRGRPGSTRHPQPHSNLPRRVKRQESLKSAVCNLSVERREIKF